MALFRNRNPDHHMDMVLLRMCILERRINKALLRNHIQVFHKDIFLFRTNKVLFHMCNQHLRTDTL